MRTPISYYGGKQNLAATILGLIPPHRLYCEPFIGGAAVFFAREPSKVEIINDTNGEIINFYEVLKRDFTALEKEVAISLHSRKQHRQARVIYENPDLFDRVKRAWAVWVLANGSYGCMLDGGFGYDRVGTTSRKLDNKRVSAPVRFAEIAAANPAGPAPATSTSVSAKTGVSRSFSCTVFINLPVN